MKEARIPKNLNEKVDGYRETWSKECRPKKQKYPKGCLDRTRKDSEKLENQED